MFKFNKMALIFVLASLGTASFVSCSQQNTSIVAQQFQGQGAPSQSLGSNGDTYTDTLTNNQYIKVNGTWVLMGNENPQELTGTGIPSKDLGNNGDFYTDTSNGNYYNKQNGVWVLIREGDNTQTHTVTFDLNGGQLPDGSISIPSQEVKHGEWARRPAQDPSKLHSTFLGWFSGSQEWVFTSSVYGDLVLTAKYSVNEDQKITFTVDPNNGEEPYVVETFVGDSPRINTPTKDGYNFVGWYYKDTNTKYEGYATSDLSGKTIVARYEKSVFNFTYQVEEDGTATITGLLDINSVSVTIPQTANGYTVARIGEKAFQNRIYVTSITLPSTIKEIHPKAFNGARALISINVDASNPYYTSVDGVVYSKDMKTLVHCPPRNATTFHVPQSVTKIGDYAFYQHKYDGVSDIYFKEGLVEIGEKAFYENFMITSLRFPSTLRVIGKGAFNCVAAEGIIQSVHFNEGLEVIDDQAFVGAYFKDALKLPSSVKKIGSYAFANCTAITKFTFPKSLEELGDNPFSSCTGILEIDVEEGCSNYTVINNVLYDANVTKAIMCPSGNTDKVVIEDGVKEIGNYAFYMVDKTMEYEFPSSLTKIGKYAFAHCYDLREFVIPDTVTELGEGLFDCCDNLSSITIGTGIKEIPVNAFIDCFSLDNVIIPSNVKKISKQAFFGCSSIKSLTLNEGLEEIGNAAFSFSTTEYNDGDKPTLSSIVLPESLITLGERVFAGQNALKSLTIGKNVQTMTAATFEDLSLNTLTISSENQYFTNIGPVIYNKTKTEVVFAVAPNDGAITIEEGVKTIAPFAFYSARASIKSISLPNSLEEIGEGAFQYTKVTSFNFGPNLKTIGDGAFYLGSVSQVTFSEGLETIGVSAFSSNDIEVLNLPNSLKTIGETAFSGQWKLNTLKFGTGLESLGDRAFYNCKKLTGAINVNAPIKYWGKGVFLNNEKITDITITGSSNYVTENGIIYNSDKTSVVGIAPLHTNKTITLPSTVTRIEDYGLCGAYTVTSLTLPSSLKYIGENALTNMIKVSSLNIPSSVTFVGREAFQNWGGTSTMQTITFACSQDYALANFDQNFLMGIGKSLNVVYAGV